MPRVAPHAPPQASGVGRSLLCCLAGRPPRSAPPATHPQAARIRRLELLQPGIEAVVAPAGRPVARRSAARHSRSGGVVQLVASSRLRTRGLFLQHIFDPICATRGLSNVCLGARLHVPVSALAFRLPDSPATAPGNTSRGSLINSTQHRRDSDRPAGGASASLLARPAGPPRLLLYRPLRPHSPATACRHAAPRRSASTTSPFAGRCVRHSSSSSGELL